MMDRDVVRLQAAPRALGGSHEPIAENTASAAEIAAQLDEIVGKSRRLPLWRRGLRRVSGAVAHWLDELVPPAPPSGDSEPPPQIRFPFY